MKRASFRKRPSHFGIVTAVLIGFLALASALAGVVFTSPSQAAYAAQHHAAHKVYFPTRAEWARLKKTHKAHGVFPAVQGSGNLAYGGGPVQRSPKTYIIFWGSGWSGSAPANIIQSYFNDLGGTSFENILTQYYDSSGNINNTESVGGVWFDTSTPTSDTSCGGSTVQDSSLQSEVNRAISTNGWPRDGTNGLYLVYTPSGYYINDGTGACSAPAGNYCAYHNWSSSDSVAYAAMPYPGSGCTVSTSPNGNTAGDSEANLTSHEEFEAISDPQPASGWVDSSGYEIGDKCAWDFSQGTTALNSGGTFELQTEYSNATSSCVNSYGTVSGNPPTVSGFSPTSGAVGTSVTVTGTNFTGATAVTFNGTSASFSVGSGTSITATVPSGATSGPISVTNAYGTGTSSASFSVTTGGGGGNTAQLVVNGGFENGQSPWTETSSGGYQLIDTTNPHTGSDSAYLCGYNNCTDSIRQSVTIPSTMTKTTLSFYLYIDTNEATGAPCYDNFYARIRTSGGTTITTPVHKCNTDANNAWTHYSVDLTSALSAYKGQTVQIYFLGNNDYSLPTDFFVDDVTFTVNY